MTRISESNFSGCLLGGAVGDALGWAVEFDSMKEIRKRFGNNGIQDLALNTKGVAEITDDTQMTMFTAEGLLHANSTGSLRHFEACTSYVHSAYLRWLATQGELQGEQASAICSAGGLITIPDLNARRAPGATCLTALKSGTVGTIEDPVNNSKGCGGVMRVAPVGLICAARMNGTPYDKALSETFELGSRLAAITHGHPSGYLSAGVFASIIFGIARGNSLIESIRDARSVLVYRFGHEECLELLDLAVILSDNQKYPSSEAVAKIGEGWTGDEALAIGVYCALASGGDFLRGVRLAVNHDGDSDSTGSITGNILGLLHGRNAIPASFLDSLELRTVIKRTGELLVVKG